MATTAQHLAARSDPDLLQRLIAAAEMANIPSASTWVQANLGALLGAPVQDNQTISDVRAYADTVRQNAINAIPPAPGLDPAAVTDTHLYAAIQAVSAQQAP